MNGGNNTLRFSLDETLDERMEALARKYQTPKPVASDVEKEKQEAHWEKEYGAYQEELHNHIWFSVYVVSFLLVAGAFLYESDNTIARSSPWYLYIPLYILSFILLWFIASGIVCIAGVCVYRCAVWLADTFSSVEPYTFKEETRYRRVVKLFHLGLFYSTIVAGLAVWSFFFK